MLSRAIGHAATDRRLLLASVGQAPRSLSDYTLYTNVYNETQYTEM